MIMRGDIYMAKIPVIKNSSVQGGCRPVLIVQNNAGNAHAPTVQVVPLTSRCKRKLPVHMTISGYGLTTESTILAEQIQTIDQTALENCLGHVDDIIMEKVNRCILIQLGIPMVKK